MEYHFSTLYVSQLPISDLFSISRSTIEYAKPVRIELGTIPDIALSKLEITNAAMGEQMNRQRKNELTPAVDQAEMERDGCHAELKRNVKTASLSRSPERSEAGQKMMFFLEPYWHSDKRSMNTQTGIFMEMHEKYMANPLLQQYAAIIGVDGLMTELNTLNQNFDNLYQTRNTMETTEGPTASSLKTAVVRSYEQFCSSIEQAAEFTPSPTLSVLFSQMDGVRKVYARQVNPKEESDTQPDPSPAPVE